MDWFLYDRDLGHERVKARAKAKAAKAKATRAKAAFNI